VTVNDVEDPLISCPADDNVNNDAGLCSAVVDYDQATAIDNCQVQNVGLDDGAASGSAFPVGKSTNTFIATDLAGNQGKSSSSPVLNNIHVIDHI
jgi:hypothetical protein